MVVFGWQAYWCGNFQACTISRDTKHTHPLFSQTYVEAERELIVATEYIAAQSMKNAVKEFRSHSECHFDGNYVLTIASYDDSYQQRSGKSGGGVSRYCFAAAISTSIGKVLSYDIASNSCKLCKEYENLRSIKTTPLCSLNQCWHHLLCKIHLIAV